MYDSDAEVIQDTIIGASWSALVQEGKDQDFTEWVW